MNKSNIIKYKDQTDIDINQIFLIKKDRKDNAYLTEEFPFAIAFYLHPRDAEFWRFKTKRTRDTAYAYVCNHKSLEAFEMSPVRKDFDD